MTTNPSPSTSHPSLANDILLALFFAFLFVSITLTIGAFLVFTSSPEPTPLIFPVTGVDGAVALTRLFCDLPK